MKKKILFIIFILFILLSSHVLMVFAANKSDLQQQSSDLQTKIDQTKHELGQVEDNLSGVMAQVRDLTVQISEYQSEIDNLNMQISDLENQIQNANVQKDKKENNLPKDIIKMKPYIKNKNDDNKEFNKTKKKSKESEEMYYNRIRNIKRVYYRTII